MQTTINIFISYSKEDKKLAEKLELDLKEQGSFQIWIDKESLPAGGNWRKDVDDGLRKADHVLCMLTSNYLKSENATEEAYAAIQKGTEQGRNIFIPLFFEKRKKLDLPPTWKNIQGIDFSKDYDAGLAKLLRQLQPKEEKSGDILAKIEGKDSPNPFRRIRAEYFDHDYESLAKIFFEPEKEKYDIVKGRTPVIIMGGRGSGKTMILKSLTADVSIKRHKADSFKDADIDFFGVYTKLTRGVFALSSKDSIEEIGIKKSRAIFLTHFNLTLIFQVIELLNQYKNKPPLNFSIDLELETEICKQIAKKINPRVSIIPSDFIGLLVLIDEERSKINDYVNRLIIGEDIKYSGFFTDIEFLNTICAIVIKSIPELLGCRIYFLLDEYENLMEFQQVIVNTLIKHDPQYVGIKIATKFEGLFEPPMTLFDQALQEGHDYHSIILDYDLSKGLTDYKKLILGITENILIAEGYPIIDIKKYFPSYSGMEISDETFNEEFEKLLKLRKINPKKLTDEDRKNLLKHYRMAIIFRGIKKKYGKIYSGFDTFLYLSSGIVRYFLNLCGMTFYHAEANDIKLKKGNPIPPKIQTWAAYRVSEAYIERLSSNVENYGEDAQRFVMDMGDIFRERLLSHNSEPESLALSIIDYENISNSDYYMLNGFLKTLVRESIFHKKAPTKEYRPKDRKRTRPTVFTLNRIYAPALEISYRARWERCHFKVSELKKLLDKDERNRTKRLLQSRQRTDKEETSIFLDDYMTE